LQQSRKRITATQERNAVVRYLLNKAYGPSNVILGDFARAAADINDGKHLEDE
jgi:hypothetical protein